MLQPPLILASRSPRRRELLAQAGYQFQVIVPEEDIECGVCSESGPAALVAELAYRKAAAVIRKLQREPVSTPIHPSPASIIVSADTVAECDGFILGKPRDESDARKILSQLSGRGHRVFTGVCVWPLAEGMPLVRVAISRLQMDPLSETQLDEYLASGQWEGKAGAFGYQDRLGWVHILEGSESNVVGLPLELLAEMLDEVSGAAPSRRLGFSGTAAKLILPFIPQDAKFE